MNDLDYWEAGEVRNREPWLMLAHHLRYDHGYGLRRLSKRFRRPERAIGRMLKALNKETNYSEDVV